MASVLTGLERLINRHLGLYEAGPEKCHQKSVAFSLSTIPRSFDAKSLIRLMLCQIEHNWSESRNGGSTRSASRQNWRWEKQLYISDHNSSEEKQVEKAIAADCGDDWVNQVPTISGLLDGTSEKHCNIDLVHRIEDGNFEFIELKIESDTPLFAAFEVLKYGLVYVFSRQYAAELGYDPANDLLNATSVTLCVLAPTVYFAGYDLRWLEAELSKALHSLGAPGLTMDFRFEHFPATATTATGIVKHRQPFYQPTGWHQLKTSKNGSRTDTTGRAYAGSQRQIQTYVNEHPGVLTQSVVSALDLNQSTAAQLSWVSPLKGGGYREYRDGEFLRAVGLGHLEDALKQFWPQRGPCWDALARIPNGCILVEAKSHVPEVYGGGCGAGEKSRPKIVDALEQTKQWMGVPPETDWLGKVYQSANRYAFLFFLREIAGVEAYLVNVYFQNDPHSPTSSAQWEEGLKKVEQELGIQSKAPFCGSVFLDAMS